MTSAEIKQCVICGSLVGDNHGRFSYRNINGEEYNYTFCCECSYLVTTVVKKAKDIVRTENED